MINKEAIRILTEMPISTMSGRTFEEIADALELAINAIEENDGLRLLVEWAVQCDFGYDNFPEEYEKYKEQVKDMDYVEGMIYIASKEAKND